MRRFKLLFYFDACGGMISLPKKMSDEEDLKRHSVSPFKKKREKVSKKKAKKEKFCRIGKKSQGPFSAFFCSSPFYSVRPLLTEWIRPQTRGKSISQISHYFFAPSFCRRWPYQVKAARPPPIIISLKRVFLSHFGTHRVRKRRGRPIVRNLPNRPKTFPYFSYFIFKKSFGTHKTQLVTCTCQILPHALFFRPRTPPPPLPPPPPSFSSGLQEGKQDREGRSTALLTHCSPFSSRPRIKGEGPKEAEN